jgi:hypothetical protein
MHAYEEDPVAWADEQASALREKRIEDLDWENLAEEVEDLGGSKRDSVSSHMSTSLMHQLKWDVQPERRCRSWIFTIGNAQGKIRKLLRKNPSLKPLILEYIEEEYNEAVRLAVLETGIKKAAFPEYDQAYALDLLWREVSLD